MLLDMEQFVVLCVQYVVHCRVQRLSVSGVSRVLYSTNKSSTVGELLCYVSPSLNSSLPLLKRGIREHHLIVSLPLPLLTSQKKPLFKPSLPYPIPPTDANPPGRLQRSL